MQHGLNEPEFCQRCGCPRFEIIRQWRVLGKIEAVWRCTHCDARNRSTTNNTFIEQQKAKEEQEPPTNATRRRRQTPD